jgi:magnesium-transporting ATPase (P-type)
MEIDLNTRYQTMTILWFALLMSVVMFFVISIFAAPRITHDPTNPPSAILIFGLTALGTFLVVMSFVVKGKLLEGSVAKQDINLVQKGLVVACAMCEASAMLGLLERFVVGNRESYLLFLLAIVGTAAHFPRRSHLEAASFKSTHTLN